MVPAEASTAPSTWPRCVVRIKGLSPLLPPPQAASSNGSAIALARASTRTCQPEPGRRAACEIFRASTLSPSVVVRPFGPLLQENGDRLLQELARAADHGDFDEMRPDPVVRPVVDGDATEVIGG